MIVHPVLARARFERSIVALLESPSMYEKAGLRKIHYEFPILIVELHSRRHERWLRLRVDATDYDYRPLQGWWVDAQGAPLVAGSSLVPQGAGFQINPAPNQERRCWFCFKGWRDWHDHSSHQDTAWAAIRPQKEFSPLALLLQLISDFNNPNVALV